jgi:hypothetical protein
LYARLGALEAALEEAKGRRAERIRVIEDEFRSEVREIESLREAISNVLAIEDRLHGEHSEEPSVPIADFLVRAAAKYGPRSKEQFRAMAKEAGYVVDGRTIHATVVNIVRGGRLEMLEDGRFGVPSEQPQKQAGRADAVPF